VLWFVARVSVYKNSHCIGADVLGGCAYRRSTSFSPGIAIRIR